MNSRQSRLFYSIKYNSKERRYNGEKSCAIFDSLTLYVFNQWYLCINKLVRMGMDVNEHEKLSNITNKSKETAMLLLSYILQSQ